LTFFSTRPAGKPKKGPFANGRRRDEIPRQSAILELVPRPSGPVQALAVKNYQLWLTDPDHPSLHFHRLRGSSDRYSVRVGDHYRAIGRMGTRDVLWVWIGTHEEYNRLVRGERTATLTGS
jgi:hypothetical protein